MLPSRPRYPDVRRLPGRTTILAVVIASALLASACHSTTPVPTPNLIGPKAVRIQGPIHTRGTAILDVTGRTVRFDGVGVRDFVTVGASASDCVKAPPKSEATNIADWGFNSVRIPLAWANLEPNAPTTGPDGTLQHAWDATYLGYLDGFVQQVTSRGLAVMFTIHTKFPSNTDKGLCNLTSMPSWLYPGGMGDTSQAKCDFLAGVSRPGAPEDIWDGLQAVWSMLAGRYASNPQVVGADLVNEPYPGGPCGPGDTKLADLYQKLGAAIRQANPDIALIFEDAPPRLVLAGHYELTKPPAFADVIYSYHLYQQNWDPVGKSVDDAFLARARAWKVPLLVGEFNAFGDAAPAGAVDKNWQADSEAALAYWKQNGISWMAWAYSGGNHLINKNGSPRADLISTFQKGF